MSIVVKPRNLVSSIFYLTGIHTFRGCYIKSSCCIVFYVFLCNCITAITLQVRNVNVDLQNSDHALGGVICVASFITTDEQLQSNRGCCFLVQAMLSEGFPIHQFNLTYYSWCLVHVCCLHLKMEFRSCAGGVSGVASFITTDEQLQSNRGCCFLVQAMLPEGFPFQQFNLAYYSWC